jgi:glutathione synthase/RimK-type ligase-like ATP-grasp enzyme
MGVRTFPNSASFVHFDDKVHQYFLLKAGGYPVVPSQISFSLADAFNQYKNCILPKVFKLKGGAGSQNVVLIRSKLHLYYLIIKSFSIGHSQFNSFRYFRDSVKGVFYGRNKFVDLIKGVYRLIIPPKEAIQTPRERGYFYTQDFIPGNRFDVRVIVIANKAIAIRRMNRPNDFRASGSGNISYDATEIPLETLSTAMSVSLEQGYNCMAYDFIMNEKGEPLIVEMSYGFSQEAYDECPGHWNDKLEFVPGKVCLQDWMLESLINETC